MPGACRSAASRSFTGRRTTATVVCSLRTSGGIVGEGSDSCVSVNACRMFRAAVARSIAGWGARSRWCHLIKQVNGTPIQASSTSSALAPRRRRYSASMVIDDTPSSMGNRCGSGEPQCCGAGVTVAVGSVSSSESDAERARVVRRRRQSLGGGAALLAGPRRRLPGFRIIDPPRRTEALHMMHHRRHIYIACRDLKTADTARTAKLSAHYRIPQYIAAQHINE